MKTQIENTPHSLLRLKSKFMSKKQPTILLVNWGTESAITPLRETIKLLTNDMLYLATTHQIPKQIATLFKSENIIYTNPYNTTQLIQDTYQFAIQKNINFDIITTFFEMNVYQTAVLADFFECKKSLPARCAIRSSVNKLIMRQTLKLAHILQPRFLQFDQSSIAKAYDFFSTLQSAAVIKPIHSGHSYGARFVKQDISENDFRSLFLEANNDLSQSYDEWMDFNSKQPQYILEEFIPGNVISFDGVIQKPNEINFIGNSEFEMMEPPLLQQVGHTSPSWNCTDEELKLGHAYVTKVIQTLGLQYCGFHCELKYKHGQPVLVEIAARLPGGQVLETYQNLSSENIYYTFWSIFGLKKYCNLSHIVNKNPILAETRIGVFTQKYGRIIRTPKLPILKTVHSHTNLIFKGKEKNDWIIIDNKVYDGWIGDLIISSTQLRPNELVKIRNASKRIILGSYSLDNFIPKKIKIKKALFFVQKQLAHLFTVS